VEYSNPRIPEEINYSKDNPLKEFALLAAAVVSLLAVVAFAVNVLARNYAHHIPFAYEAKIMPAGLLDKESGHQDIVLYLNSLAGELAANMDLPPEMRIQVNYSDSSEINAAATLNGQIIINKGLLDYIKSENELAFIIGHEIAHIKARHPIKSLSSGLILGIAAGIIAGHVHSSSAANVMTTGSTLTSLSFSRSQEEEADELALKALYTHYGHIGGSRDFFARLLESKKIADYLQFAGTHPGLEDRIERIQRLTEENGFGVQSPLALVPVRVFASEHE
jgi:beta-barrel assembly-enhancing protease